MARDSLDITRLPILDALSLLQRQGIDPKLSDWRTLIGLNDEFFDHMVRDPFYRYAEAIQLAPASEADHHANPGGLLSHSYDVITLGLKRRRGLQLPHGGSIDQINEQRHLWTYAVFAGGLLHDVGKLMASIRLRLLLKKGTYYHWTPQDKPLCEFKDAVSYCVEFVKTPYSYHTQIALTLFDFLPTSGRAWLARESHIMMQLCAFLRGDRYESGVIGEILESADMASTALSQKLPVLQRFSTKPSTIERLVHWVRNWIIEGEIKINKNGALGWVDTEGHLFMVCRSLADKIIHHCDQNSITDIPRDPIRLYDIFQDYGFALPTPEGKAIWNMLIECDDYKHALTCLKFEARRFTIPTRPLAAFDGLVKVYGERKTKENAKSPVITKAGDTAMKMESQLRDALSNPNALSAIGGDQINPQEPVLNQDPVFIQEAGPFEEAAQSQDTGQYQDAITPIGGGVNNHPDPALQEPAEHLQGFDDELSLAEPVIEAKDAYTKHHKETGITQETTHTWETDAEEAACVITQETAASDQSPTDTFVLDDEPIFLDRVEGDTPILMDPISPLGPLSETTLKSENLQEIAQVDQVAVTDPMASDLEVQPEKHKKFSRYTISGVPSYEPGMVTMDAPDLARMFVTWLRINMLGKTIQMNCPEALVHIMEDCVLLLAPGIFKNFLQVHGVGAPEEIEKNHKKLSDKFQKLKINIKTNTQPSINIHKVYAVGKFRASKLNGWKIPLNIIYSDNDKIPEPNRFLKLTPDI